MVNYYAAVRSITPGIMPQGICPAGWHIPDNEEWNTMIETASAANSAGKLATGCLWQTSDVVGAAGNPEGRNASQFNVVPAGRYMGAGNPHYLNLGEGAFFWSATKNGSDAAYMRQIAYNDATVSAPTTNTYNAASVRCLRDELTQPPHPELSLTASPDQDSITFCQNGDTAVTYTAVVAKTLTGEILTTEYTYQWRVNGDVIANQTANTYKHTYSVTGTYTVTCIATPNVGGDPLEKTLTVKVGVSNPRFTLNTENAATGEVTLTEMADVNAVRWQENTDFVPVSGSSAEHQYTLSGSYTITAKDTTLDNCETTGPEVQVTVPKLTIEKLHGYDTICNDVNGSTDKPVAAILYKASVEGPTATSYTWSVSPSTNVTVTPFAHSDSCLVVYPTAGTYQVTCEATGTSLSDTISVTVTQATGTETFGVCVEDKTVTFKAFVENTNKTSTTYHLYWGDGQISEIPEKSAISSIFHTYSEAGTYSLIAVKDLSDNKCSTKKQIVVLDGVPRTACPASSWLSNETQNADGDSITAVTDVDNLSYRVVYLGGKCWMAENLRVSKYADDASINTVTNGATYYPNDNVDNVPEYGLLYNWYAATRGQSGSGVQGICPDGWHVPTKEELPNDYFSEAGKLAGGCDWNVYVNTGNLNGKFPGNYSYSDRNVTGFGAVPAGYYYANGNSSQYQNFGNYAKLWLSDGHNLAIHFNFEEIDDKPNYYNYRDFKPDGFSVRCVRDSRVYTLSIGTNVETPSVVDGDVQVIYTANLTDGGRIVERGFTYAWAVLDSVEGTHFEMPNTSTAECTITFKAGHPGIYRVSCTASIDGGSNNLMVKDTISVTVTNVFKVNKQNQCVIYGTDQTATSNTTIGGNEIGVYRGDTLTYITKVRDNDAPTPNEYNVVQIGTQCWMKENMRATKYSSNGSQIGNGSGYTSMDNSYKRYYYPNNNSQNVDVYGLLYNWNAVMNGSTTQGVQGICPNGWHVPSDEEWCTMEDYVNGSTVVYQTTLPAGYGGTHAGKLAIGDWTSSTEERAPGNTNFSDRNSSGFSALPAGNVTSPTITNGSFGNQAFFWTSTSTSISNNASRHALSYDKPGVQKQGYQYGYNTVNAYVQHAASVRCVRN